MQKIHQRKNVGKIILSPMKEPEPEPEPKPAAAAAEAPKEGVCLYKSQFFPRLAVIKTTCFHKNILFG